MVSIKIEFGGMFLVVLQIILLVLYYGGIISAKTPWWVVWLPGLILAACSVVGVVVLGIVLLFVAYISWKVNRKIEKMIR